MSHTTQESTHYHQFIIKDTPQDTQMDKIHRARYGERVSLPNPLRTCQPPPPTQHLPVFTSPEAPKALSSGVLWRIHYLGELIKSFALKDQLHLRPLMLPSQEVGVEERG